MMHFCDKRPPYRYALPATSILLLAALIAAPGRTWAQSSVDLTAAGAPIVKVTAPRGGGNKDIEVIRDGDTPPVGNTQSSRQYDSWDGSNQAADDWYGYTFAAPITFTQMVFQEGRHFSDGGWFLDLKVQVRVGGVWGDAAGLVDTPPYPGLNDGVSFQTYTLDFDPVVADGIRIFGTPGGANEFTSVGELRVFGVQHVCGDGVVNPGSEQCDDAGESAACNTDCTFAVCGDAKLNPSAGEACDDGGQSAACDTDCTVPACGDAVTNVAAGEECDDAGESPTCDADCTGVTCGDGTTNNSAGEQCDAGGETFGCDIDCTVAGCGDGVLNQTRGEQCEPPLTATCDSNCGTRAPLCGDTFVTPPELCDDTNTVDGDGCDSNCTPTACGNTIVTAGEECDDGNLDENDACSSACTITACGNGNLDAGEACDDGNVANGDGCDFNCTPTGCGNGIVTTPETCDDGNGADGDGCDSNCTPTACGNGILTTPEACDDGNGASGDGCDSNCTPTACGNGIVTAPEFCDDSGESAACDSDCSAAACGDANVNQTAGEECDDGGTSATCDPDCTSPICGDATLNSAAGEACDDGNTTSDDGCGPSCAVETCGDGIVNNGEQCDPPGTTYCDAGCQLVLPIDMTQEAIVIARVTAPTGGGNHNIEIIRDGDIPPIGTNTSRRQYDTYDGSSAAADDWIGYDFPSTRLFASLFFQEGRHFSGGGWFDALTVQVRQNGAWVNVSGLTDTPTYPGFNDGVTFESYAFEFQPIAGQAIRLFGDPGGFNDFISVGELLVYGFSEYCGDGVLSSAEECDDGNSVGGDGCSAGCTTEVCGDSIVNSASEQCDDGNAIEGDGCDTNCTFTACGNSVATAGEACDDGNLADGDGCDSDCSITVCGNGIVTTGEQCDDAGESITCDSDCTPAACGDGTFNPTAGEVCDSGGASASCDTDCTAPVCGDGIFNPAAGEACDSGAQTAACDGDCTLPACGDGTLNTAAGEACDDSNTIDGDGCDSNCSVTTCGNGIVSAGEECDDGNINNGDACTSTCTLTLCGNGQLDGSEQCDTAGQSVTCDVDCTFAACGDGLTNTAAGETCDTGGESASCDTDCTIAGCGDGTQNSAAGETCDDSGESAVCDLDCTAAVCGDGVTNVTAGESCDTAGQSASCDTDCTPAVCGDGTLNSAAGETCDDGGESAVCDLDCTAAVCGDGSLNSTAGEACDDGNTANDDGCSAACATESCGDGIVNGTEGCEPPGTPTCSSSCTVRALENLTQLGSSIARVPFPTGGGSKNIEIIRDGDKPPVGNNSSSRQFDSYDGNTPAADDWIGYAYGGPATFTRVVWQEGKHFGSGGWFDAVTVQVLRSGVWEIVTGLTETPPYPAFNDGVNFETYTFDFDPIEGDAIRIYGDPGGFADFISTAELEVFGYAHVCGDGISTSPEGCDDGNNFDGDGCSSACTVEFCGDGIANNGEDCDSIGESSACDPDCTFSICGDGFVNASAAEACDSGGESATCDDDCTSVQCGDGNHNATAGEQCDTAGVSATCDSDCTPPSCGDGTVNTVIGETCEPPNTATCAANCAARAPLCGDSFVTPPEVCDDTNTASGDGCDANCTPTACGNGIITFGEECDDGNLIGGDTCSATCSTTLCGNGAIDAGEQCDDGNAASGDGCDANCTPSACGNGVTAPNEECDDANTTDDDGCDSNCTATSCGNGVVTVGEACDDGNLTDDDGCDSNCTATACGNGILTQGEQCDDGGETSNCDTDCTQVVCGDLVLNAAAGEQCDGGGATAACDTDCSFPLCGDGVLNGAAGEECDDANTAAGDGCNGTCVIEFCNDGIVNDGEQCDPPGTAVCDDTCADRAPDDITQLGTIIVSVPTPTGGGNKDPEVIRDGDMPPAGSTQGNRQYDTFDGAVASSFEWMGYQYLSSQTFRQVIFQEGKHYSDGGWFETITVEILQNGTWNAVTGFASTPLYPAINDGVNYNTYVFDFDAVEGDGIRIAGQPGGAHDFTSIAELLIYGISHVCGDAIFTSDEQCEDGNTLAGDGCGPTCLEELCGDGLVNNGNEECDDAGESTTCNDDCTFSVCGDAKTNAAAGEECDAAGESAACNADCTAAVCGDGQTNPSSGETCDDNNTVDGDGCDSNCKPTGCANGIATAGEQCDDANLVDDDGCDSNCTVTACGNGVITSGESCDDGGESSTCDLNCTPALCGDGTLNATSGEACDDANAIEGDGCDTNCTFTACGNALVSVGESCDDGNLNSGDGCDANCTPTGCGNAIRTLGEACDDGNTTDGDGCESTCTPTGCGDAIVAPPEVCDDGNITSGDGCDNNCTTTACGNAVVTAGEQCDDGGFSSTCDADCTPAVCGDGLVNAVSAEACDDAGESATCNTDCTVAVCGDAITNAAAGEDCDDGGESATCDVDCSVVTCGDGTLNLTASEQCDNGASNSDTAPDACRTSCALPICGDDTVDSGEECDAGALNSDTQPDACRGDCSFPACGDGVTDGPEECDDANTDNLDACIDDCTAASCGDGFVETGVEDCDDANTSDNDACLSTCVAASCGDGSIFSGFEGCDDGVLNNDGAADSCRTSCVPAYCGDNVVDTGEECEPPGTANCTLGCAVPVGLSTPAGFLDTAVITGLVQPTSVRFVSDGRVFIAEKRGIVKVFDDLNDTSPEIFVDLRTSVHNYWDRGLVGLELHPNFPTTPYLYVMYTLDAPPGGTPPVWGTVGGDVDTCPSPPGGAQDGCVVAGRVSRFEALGNNAFGPEIIMVEDWCQQFPSHSIGALGFDDSGALLASGGDGASFTFSDWGQAGFPDVNPCGDPPGGVGALLSPPDAEGGALRAQDLRTSGDPTSYSGTVIRIDPITAAPMPDNPLVGGAVADDDAIIAFGLRNPVRMTARSGTREVFISDVGWGKWEEINRINDTTGPVPPNFGWPCYEGPAPMQGYDVLNLDICENLYGDTIAPVTGPFYTYSHFEQVEPGEKCGTGSSATTGVAFYQGGGYPPEFNGALFFADYSRDCIWSMKTGTDGNPDPATRATFSAGAQTPVDLQIGPQGDLFYVDIVGGELRRIQYFPGNQPPVAVAWSDKTNGAAPLTVNFDASSSTDGDPGDTLSYRWDLDGDGQLNDATTVSPAFNYTQPGSYVVTLEADDGNGGTDTDTIAISVGNTPPTATISLQSGNNWGAGSSVAFSGTAIDTQDGSLPDSAMVWDIILHHCPSDCHIHFLNQFVGVSSASLPAPDHEYPSILEIRLTVTDSGGLQDTESVFVSPQPVTITLQTSPPGLELGINAESAATPLYATVIANSNNTVSAPSPQTVGATTYEFVGWSDAGAGAHDVGAGTTAFTLTATFQPVP